MNDKLAVSWLTQIRALTGNDDLSIVLLLVSAILAAILRRLFKGEGMARSILKRIAGPTRLAAILLGLVIVLPAAEFNAEFADNVRCIMKIGMAILLGWSAVIAINAAAHRAPPSDRRRGQPHGAARAHADQHSAPYRARRRIAANGRHLSCDVSSGPGIRCQPVASAGVAGLVLGFAARPILTNLIAGMQIALTQPIRIDDVLIVEGEWGWVE